MAGIDTTKQTVGQLLKQSTPYKVPRFQRDYSWEAEQIEQLWNDFSFIIEEELDSYFIGSIVLRVDDEIHGFEVIDGQQRLTAITILLCALRDILSKAKHAAARKIHTKFIVNDSFSNEDLTPKLTLNDSNRQFFHEMIVENADANKLNQTIRNRQESVSNKRMAQAYLFFAREFNKLIDSGESIDEVVASYTDVIEKVVTVIQITVGDEQDAYVLFETLNDRGLDLSVADLFKNYFFAKAGSRIDDVQQNWMQMLNYLGKNIEIKRFLRHYWLSRSDLVRDKDLFRRLKQDYSKKTEVIKFSRDLKAAANCYASLNDPLSEYWHSFNPNDRKNIEHFIEDLKLFGVNQYNPLLLSVLETNKKIFPSVLKLTWAFAFRYTVILHRTTGSVEKPFASAALFVRENRKCSAKDVFTIIERLYPTDQEFTDAFKQESFTSAKIARYILRKIDDCQDVEGKSVVNDDSQKITLEHILPKNPTLSDWKEFHQDPGNIGDYIHRLGNMTLVSASQNRRLANLSFKQKLKIYREDKNPLKISLYPFKQEQWAAKNVEENQKIMTNFAKQIWRVDF